MSRLQRISIYLFNSPAAFYRFLIMGRPHDEFYLQRPHIAKELLRNKRTIIWFHISSGLPSNGNAFYRLFDEILADYETHFHTNDNVARVAHVRKIKEEMPKNTKRICMCSFQLCSDALFSVKRNKKLTEYQLLHFCTHKHIHVHTVSKAHTNLHFIYT